MIIDIEKAQVNLLENQEKQSRNDKQENHTIAWKEIDDNN